GGPQQQPFWCLPRMRFLLLLAVVFFPGVAFAQTADETFLATLAELRDASFADKSQIVSRLRDSGHSSARAVLSAFLEDRLFVLAPDRRVVIARTADDAAAVVELIDPVSLK